MDKNCRALHCQHAAIFHVRQIAALHRLNAAMLPR